jgi:hypothetical protein
MATLIVSLALARPLAWRARTDVPDPAASAAAVANIDCSRNSRRVRLAMTISCGKDGLGARLGGA